MSETELIHQYPSQETIRKIRRKALKFFDSDARDLPWRKEHDDNGYRTWVSEIMLQQTQVVTVKAYFLRFMKAFPTVKALAEATEEEVLKLWEGLGYYRRARSLHAAAKMIVEKHDGVFPQTFEDVIDLPGVGRYTAGAILSIAFDQKQPILEGNTIRLFSRLIQLEEDVKKTASQKLLWQFAEDLLPNKNCGDFNQSLMEIGALVCKPTSPECNGSELLNDSCPFRSHCPTFANSLQATIPFSEKKTVYEKRNDALLLLINGNKVLLQKHTQSDWWDGLWDFPRCQLDRQVEIQKWFYEKSAISIKLSKPAQTIRHAVTKYRIKLDCYLVEEFDGKLKRNSGFIWKPLSQIDDLPMNSTARKVADKLLANN